MADGSKIEWTDATWNVVNGCSVVSPGCTNCYAMRLAGGRMKNHPTRAGLTRPGAAGPVWTGEVRFVDSVLDQPLRWKRPRRIFVCAHGDLFHPAVPDAWIDRVFAVMALAPQHVFQVLTKRADRMRDYLTARGEGGFGRPPAFDPIRCARDRIETLAFDLLDTSRGRDAAEDWVRSDPPWPLPNVWLGVSVEDQRRADERVPPLLETPAAVRWISAEPLLGPVDLLAAGAVTVETPGREPAGRIDWVVAGGESGPGARPCHPAWLRGLRDQCAAAGVPFHFKQWGEWYVGEPSPPADDRPNPFGLPLVYPDGETFDVRSDGEDIMLSDALDHRGAPRHIWRDYWASGDGRLLRKPGKKRAGRTLDGRLHDGFPA